MIGKNNKPAWPYVLNRASDQAQGLVGWWPGGPNGGQRLFDMSGRGNHGALTNFAAPFTAASGWGAGNSSGRGALVFDGVDDYVKSVSSVNINPSTGSFTVAAWLKPFSFALVGGSNSRVVMQNVDGNNLFQLVLNNDAGNANTFGLVIKNGGVDNQQVTSATYSVNLWYHVIGVWNLASTTVKVYVNGISQALTAQSAFGAGTADNRLWIGQRSSLTGPFSGIVEDVKFYNRALFAAEVYALYNPLTRWQLRYQPGRVKYSFGSFITFDAAGNSGFKTANADYTFNRTVNAGTNRDLTFKVVILGTPGTTVTAITDDNAGTPVAATFINRGSSGTGAGIVEFWNVVAPVVGTAQVRVQLSGAVTSACLYASYFNVHQTTPTANFNSAQATNVGAADATVTITTASANSWVVAAIATTDATGIVAGQTSRNNINAASSAGAAGDEDTNAAVAIGTTAMTYPAIDALAVWVIGGFELRSDTASGGSTNYVRTASDGPTSSDSAVRTQVLARAVTGTPVSSDAATRTQVLARTLVDSPTSSDTAMRVQMLTRISSDAAATTDIATRAQVLMRITSDSPITSDATIRSQTLIRIASDSSITTDTTLRVFSGSRTTADAASTSDAATRTTNLHRTATDASSTLDSATRQISFLRSAVDSSTTADAALRLCTLQRSAADAPFTTDTASIPASAPSSIMYDVIYFACIAVDVASFNAVELDAAPFQSFVDTESFS